MKFLIELVIIAGLVAGCSRSEPPAAPATAPITTASATAPAVATTTPVATPTTTVAEATGAQKVIEDLTGKTAVDQFHKTKKKIGDISDKRNKDFEDMDMK